ncbi:MAG: hypothetical protein OQK13_00170 [Gammaproteobacteria bacterium]|nr:hypothetical protein [Gammaproteobacteria bacterium]
MPHTKTWKESGLIRTFIGEITGTEIIESNFEIHGDLRFDEIDYVINDFSNIDSCIISEDELRILSISDEVATHANKHIKIAIIANRDEIIELAKAYCELFDQAIYDTEIFSSIDEGQAWVNALTTKYNPENLKQYGRL